VFERHAVPTPFQVGPVNAYVAGRTVVDPGPDSDEAHAELLSALEDHDLAPGDVERVLVTHPHPDHFGLAARLREAGAEVVASAPAAEVVGDFARRLRHEQSYFVDFLDRHGVSRKTATAAAELPETYVQYAPDVTVDHRVGAGDQVLAPGTDHDLVVREAAGHAVGELLFEYEADGAREAVVGDQVLADITPNPLLQPPPEAGGERPRTLPAFNDSLARIRDAGYDRLLPGHREPIADPAGRVETILAAHEDRTDRVARVVAERAPVTAAAVVDELFGDLPLTETFAGMSEAVGHLDVLEARGRVDRDERGGVVVYEPA
jgi:glyoxylase-like metal-dependent hydrolase (beta-lactamase superfamily II)